MPNADIEIDGKEFVVDKIARDKSDLWFTINIGVEESQKGTPHHEFSMVVQPGGRSALTDEYLENKLQKWSDHHPEYTIKEFGVDEGRIARVGEPLERRQD